jgi:hypothetical protein
MVGREERLRVSPRSQGVRSAGWLEMAKRSDQSFSRVNETEPHAREAWGVANASGSSGAAHEGAFGKRWRASDPGEPPLWFFSHRRGHNPLCALENSRFRGLLGEARGRFRVFITPMLAKLLSDMESRFEEKAFECGSFWAPAAGAMARDEPSPLGPTQAPVSGH